MGIESALVLSGVIETLNQALSRLSSGMSRGKGCSLCDGSLFTEITGSEEGGFERTDGSVCFGSGVLVSLACGGELTFVSHGMAVDWLGADVDAGRLLVRKGSCSIDGNDPVEDSPSDGGGVVGSLTLALTFFLECFCCVGGLVLPIPPEFPRAGNPGLVGSSSLLDRAAVGHGVRCVRARGLQRHANRERHHVFDRRRLSPQLPVV